MELTPKKIYKEFQNNNLDKHTTVELLVSLIENSDEVEFRVESIEILEKIGISNNRIFEILENLFISDSNEKIRNASAKFIFNKFLDRALPLIKWAIQYESAYECIITIVKALVKVKNKESKSLLIDEIKKIKKEKYLDIDKRLDNKKYKKALKNLFKKRKIGFFTHKELAEIIINYKTIVALTKKFYSVYFELENALVVKLDLGDVEYEVRGWRADFKNNIREINEITGLEYLKNLKCLNLSNNQIKNVKDLTQLESLTYLYISKNQLKDIENLEYIKKMPNLKYLDISENELAFEINKWDFKNLEIILKKTYY